ncbi:uncharacterized protein LOC135840116 [Planococcus citri]|uniref:uncharacterized protein LOC135840116 n=1 Tax=Planococcus citri TaxID=170843 RepID=UPI0031F860D7
MDPFSVAKLGDVTIQRVTGKPDESKPPEINKDCCNDVISNNVIAPEILSKLSSSINITIKPNPSSSSVAATTTTTRNLDNVVNSSESKQIQLNELKQIQTDPNLKVLSLGPGVELRKKENPASNVVESAVSQTEETSEDAKNIDEDEEKIDQKDDEEDADDDKSLLNDDACDNEEIEKLVSDESVPSDYESEGENEKLCDAEDDFDTKMDCDSSNEDVKSDSEDVNAVQDDEAKETIPAEDQPEPLGTDNIKQECVEEDSAIDTVTNQVPAVPSEKLPRAGNSIENVECKEEQFSDEEQSSTESEDADDEFDKSEGDSQNKAPKKKKKRKPKSEPGSDDDSNETKKQKTSPADETAADSENDDKPSTEMKKGLLRKNIREVMDETKLEEATLAAQRQEMERRRRVQEQQRIIREAQRQLALNRQNSKVQARVLSLLQKGATSIIKKEEEEEEDMVEESKPNTVVVKLSTGSGPPQIVNKKVLDLLKKQNSTAEEEEEEMAKEKLVNLSKNLDKPQMMTASVSIAPIKQDSKPIEVVNDQDEEKAKDVVMISSSSGEEDDCIVISEEEEESEPDEDPTNSGMHTNDLYNIPDEQGRVLINVGHLESESDVFLAPQIARIIKPHQIGGVRFLFDNIVESLSRFETSEGFGCILAHSMGLGKTLQVVSFCDVFLRYTEAKSVLCIMPINTLQNWVAEFNMWLPTDPESSPLKEQGEILTRQFPIFVLNDNQKTLSARAKVIQNWNEEGGVLLIGYELYRQLSLKKPPKSRNRSKRKTEAEEDLEDEKCKNLLECMYSALVKPGPDLVICDEGHRIKNSHASISQALKQIRSKRRVVLTGYPLQNNLMEYWCMVDFVRPNYLGTKTEFSNMFERPIQNGQCIDSTPQDIKLMRYRAHVLHSLLEGFVQRRSHSVLQQTLPTKYEYVLLLKLTPLQKALYNTFMNEVVRTKAVPNPLKAFAVCCKIWNHPDILYNFLKKRAGDEELDLDIEETAAGIGTPASGPSTPMTPSTPPHQAANKRSRNRGGKAGKEAKLPRKNSRVNSSPTNAKTPLIATIPPNTANTTKLASPERPASTNAAMPFDSFDNQFSNFNQTNENFREFNQPNNTNQNYNDQYAPEYGSQNISNNQEYSGTNYQQNFNDSNFYNSGFNQNNFWSGNNEGGNYFNSNAPAQPTEEYFQPNAASGNSQYGSSSEYSTNTENSQGNYNNSNYNFDMNSPMNYQTEFPIKQDPGAMFGMGDNSASGSGDLMLDGGSDLNNQAFSGVGSSGEMNFRDNSAIFDSNNMTQHFENPTAMNKAGIDGVSMLNNMNEQVRNNLNDKMPRNRQQGSTTPRRGARGHSSGVRLPANNQTNFNSNFGVGQPAKPSTRGANRGRNTAMMGVRSGAVGRPRNNPNKVAPARNEELMKFKPGLPGGAPVLKHGGIPDGQQNFQNMAPNMDNQAHLLNNQMPVGADDLNTMFTQNQMNPSFLDSLRSDELWNPNPVVDQNTLFHDQNYIYEEANQILNPAQNAPNFMVNEPPSLLGGVRATRGMMNELQNNDNLFAGVQQNYQHSGSAATTAAEHDLFNYLNELNTYPISSHTSFMGLLEGDDNLGMNRNAASSDMVLKNTQFTGPPSSAVNTAPMNDGNFLETAMQFPNTNLLDQTNAMSVPSADLMAGKNTAISFEPNQSVSSSSTLPLEKDVNQSIMGLTRRGQITLKVIDKKNESQPKLNEQSIMEQSRLEVGGGTGVGAVAGGAGHAMNAQQNQAAFQNVQNRLPSIDVFNTSQNFVGPARISPESGNFTQMDQQQQQFAYADNQANTNVANASLANQTNWENFDVQTAQNQKYNVQQSMPEKPPQQFGGFNQNQRVMLPKESPQFDRRNVTSSTCKPEPVEEKPAQMPQYITPPDNRAMFNQTMTSNIQENNSKEEMHNQYVSSQNEHKKILEEKSNKSVFTGSTGPTSKSETARNIANKQLAKMNPPSSVAPKSAEKKQPQRRNQSQAARNQMAAKQFQNNESFDDSRQSSSNATPSPSGISMKPNVSTGSGKVTIKTEPKDIKSSGETENDDAKMPAPDVPVLKSVKEEPGIPYDWTNEFFKDYEPGKIEASAKTLILFCMLEEIIPMGDRLLLFSQSLFTLDLIEDFLQMFNIPGTEDKWARNKSYFRLDGSTSALEREKLINEFNSNPNVHLFLVSTRAGSLGINLVGANRVVVFDASWNPCHDTQAVCRVYRYGQQKSCYVYRFVMDNCLEKKIYDRQINKQGMSDRVVDECNPDAHLTIKDVSNLCWDDEEISDGRTDFNEFKDRYNDSVIRTIIEKFSPSLSKEPFQHESLLVDRKDKKLSQAEKRMAKRSYEMEKQANVRPSYGFYTNPQSMQNRANKPMASVRPMQADNNQAQRENPRRWIPAEVWQKQGMSAQEMILPLDVVIPTNTSDSRSSIVLKGGQKVMVLKSPKGIYMQLENGKIIAIKTAMKPAVGQNKPGTLPRALGMNTGGLKMIPRPGPERPMPLGNRRDVTVSPIRNRFAGNMRTGANMPMAGGMRPGFPRGQRPNQPIVRHFPLARPPGPQSSSPRPRLQAPGNKQIFGPNSSVTISLANKKRMENQEHSNMTEVNYEDYSDVNRLKDMQQISQTSRKFDDDNLKPEHSGDKKPQSSDYPNMDERAPAHSRGTDTSSLNYGSSQISEPSKSAASQAAEPPTKPGPSQSNHPRFSDNTTNKPTAKYSDAIPESLRFKKDINLTPVVSSGSSAKSDIERNAANMPSTMKPKTNLSAQLHGAQQHQQQQRQQQQQQRYPHPQQKLSQPNLKTPPNRRENLMASKVDPNTARGKITKTEASDLNIPESILTKKDVQLSVRNTEPVSKSSSQPAISIFPVGKKQEDGSAARSVTESSSGQMSSGFENTKNTPSSSSSYYGEYQKPYRDYYQQSNYSSNFPQHQTPEYQSQSQHSFGSSQYPPPAQSVQYSGHDYGSGSYSGSENSQYNVNPVFSNQSHSSSAPNSFNNYDQYRWQNFPQQSSKTESSQHSPVPPAPPPQQPPQ